MTVKKKSVAKQVAAALPKALARLERARMASWVAQLDLNRGRLAYVAIKEAERLKTKDLWQKQAPLRAEAKLADWTSRRSKCSTARSEARDRLMKLRSGMLRASELRDEAAEKRLAKPKARVDRLMIAHREAAATHKKAARVVASLKEKEKAASSTYSNEATPESALAVARRLIKVLNANPNLVSDLPRFSALPRMCSDLKALLATFPSPVDTTPRYYPDEDLARILAITSYLQAVNEEGLRIVERIFGAESREYTSVAGIDRRKLKRSRVDAAPQTSAEANG